MDNLLNVPDDIYTRLLTAAELEGTTPLGWIEQRLPPPQDEPPMAAKTLADLFGDLIGSVHSGGKDRLSERGSELFADYLEQKRKEGRL